jgi:hypothetical protein
MRAIIFACALAALLGSYGVDANRGASASAGQAKENSLDSNDVATLTAAQASIDASQQLRSRPRRRLSASPIATTDDGHSMPGSASDLAVHTRIQTCQGVAVTITSFGGGDWDQGLDALCEESEPADESVPPEPPAH